MPIQYDSVKPWGRLFSEYVAMFALSEADLAGSILGCGDGPASFNAEATAQGMRVTSIDPIYGMTAAQIAQRIEETAADVLAQTQANRDLFVWTAFADVEALGEARLRAMRQFVADFEAGKQEGRYVEASLPDLPFEDDTFSLALCSHYLFLYSDHVSTEAHLAAIKAMGRVAREVRVFPLADLSSQESRHVAPVIAALAAEGWTAERVRVDYEFQRGANQMLRVTRAV